MFVEITVKKKIHWIHIIVKPSELIISSIKSDSNWKTNLHVLPKIGSGFGPGTSL